MSLCREMMPTWEMKAEMERLTAENERLRAALESTEAWLERWAVHVGRCEGGHSCTCGLTAAQYEGSAALAYPAPGKEGNTND